MGGKRRRENKQLRFETARPHTGQETPNPATGARAVPIYWASSYVFDNCDRGAARFSLSDVGNIYNRLTNPTLDVFEAGMIALEGGVAAPAAASGAATLAYTFQNLIRIGDHLVAPSHIRGGAYGYLTHTFPECGVDTTFVDPADLRGLELAIKNNTKAAFIETLDNPNSDITDIEAIVDVVHRHQIPLVIDNTFVTPYLVCPIEHGADIVVYSATKLIGGHGTIVGGMIADGGKFNWVGSGKFPGLTDANASYHGVRSAQDVGAATFATRIRATLLRGTGATLSPFHGFPFLQGLESLFLRVECHVINALRVVGYLNSHPQVEAVHHPAVSNDLIQQALYREYLPNDGGSIFTFEIRGDARKAREFIDNLELFSLPANVADVKSLIIHPISTIHSQLNEEELLEQGICPRTVRPSIGTEHIDDILEDLEGAFQAVEQHP